MEKPAEITTAGSRDSTTKPPLQEPNNETGLLPDLPHTAQSTQTNRVIVPTFFGTLAGTGEVNQEGQTRGRIEADDSSRWP